MKLFDWIRKEFDNLQLTKDGKLTLIEVRNGSEESFK